MRLNLIRCIAAIVYAIVSFVVIYAALVAVRYVRAQTMLPPKHTEVIVAVAAPLSLIQSNAIFAACIVFWYCLLSAFAKRSARAPYIRRQP